MKYLIPLFLAVGIAHAAPATPAQQALIAHMVQECQGPMGKSVCRVENNDRRDCANAKDQTTCRLQAFRNRYPKGLYTSSGVFTAEEYFVYVDAEKKMCDVIVEACSADYDGRICKLGRVLWRQR